MVLVLWDSECMVSLPSVLALWELSSDSLENTSTMSILIIGKGGSTKINIKIRVRKKQVILLPYATQKYRERLSNTQYRIILDMMQTQQSQIKQPSSLPKKSILFANTTLNYIQLGELQKNVGELLMQNRNKYCKITDHKPDFSYQLYKIADFQASNRAFGKELLLRQLDRLFQEKNYLDRQLSLIKFEKEEQTDQKEKMVSEETQHFELLRNIWKKEAQRKYEGPIEHVEELNLMVAQIKHNINSLLKFQANQNREFQHNYLNTFKALHDRECKKCSELQVKNDALTDKLQMVEEKLSKMSEENMIYVSQLATRDEKLKRLSQNQLKQQTQLKDRLIRLEQDLLKRDQNIKQLKKQIAQYQLNKIANEKEGFEVIFKGFAFDFSKLQKKINISALEIFSFFTKQLGQDLKPIQNDVIRFSAKAKVQASQGSSHSCKQVFSEIPLIAVSKISQNIQTMSQKLCLESQQKSKSNDRDELKQKMQQLQVGPKRYVRTGSKRSNRQTIHTENDENDGFCYRSRVGSSTLSPFLE